MKKIIYSVLTVVLILTAVAGCRNNKDNEMSSTDGSNMMDTTSMVQESSDHLTASQTQTGSNGQITSDNQTGENNLDEYKVDIKGCRLAKDYKGKDIVIVNYTFKNNSDKATSFNFAIEDKVFQNGVGLNKCYTAADNASYYSDNQSKDIKKGSSLDIEVAYTLNDIETPIDVECAKLTSLNDEKITKTLNIK